jgi:OmpA-OmpF porin, OOP family
VTRRTARTARRTVAGLAALATGAIAVTAGCGSSESDAAPDCPPSEIPEHGDTTLVVEGDPWSGYVLFRDENLLDGTGYDLVWVEQLCQDERARDLTAGRADIMVTTLDQYLLTHPEGTLVGVIDQSLGADSLALGTVNHPELDSVDDLPALVEQYRSEGEKPVLAFTGNSPSEMLLNELVNTTEELRLSDFELVSVDQSATAYQMLQDDEAQLAVIWEPDTSAAQAAGYTISLSSADVPDSIIDVIVASDRLIERDPAAVQAVITSFYTAMDGYLAEPDRLTQLFAEDGGLDADAAGSIIDGIKLYGTRDADAFMNDDVFPLDTPQIEQSVDSIGSLLALTHPDIQVDEAKVDGSYVRELAR